MERINKYAWVYQTEQGGWVCSPAFRGIGPLRVFSKKADAIECANLIDQMARNPGKKVRGLLKKLSNANNTRRWVPYSRDN